MSYILGKLEAEVRAQMKGHAGDTVEMVGEQLLEIARGDARAAEILLTDLQNKDLGIVNAEKKIRAYADELHKKKGGNCVGVSPKKAEEILRKFYGLPDPIAAAAPAEIDPFAFL